MLYREWGFKAGSRNEVVDEFCDFCMYPPPLELALREKLPDPNTRGRGEHYLHHEPGKKYIFRRARVFISWANGREKCWYTIISYEWIQQALEIFNPSL